MSNMIYLWLDRAIDVIPSPGSDVYLMAPTQILNTGEKSFKSKFLFGGTLKDRLTFSSINLQTKLSNCGNFSVLSYIVGFSQGGFFSLRDVIFFTLRADLEDYFKCMTWTGYTMRKLTSVGFQKCGSFWVLKVLNQS